MATIGLDKLYYAPITEDANGQETYGTPCILAKAMSAEGLTNSCEKKKSKKQRRKEKIYPFEGRVPKNSKER